MLKTSLALSLVLVAGCAHTPTAPRTAGAIPVPTTPPADALLHPGQATKTAPAVYRVRFETSRGPFVVEVHRTWAPNGADRLYNLVALHFYDGAAFFRVLDGFVAQFGLSPYPKVNTVWDEAKIPDDPVTQSNVAGTLTFATAGPNTRTTQLFVNLADNPRLDKMGFSPVGKVVKGMGVVRSLYSGYGEGAPQGTGPSQEILEARGNGFLARRFPKIDFIVGASIVEPSAGGPSTAR